MPAEQQQTTAIDAQHELEIYGKVYALLSRSVVENQVKTLDLSVYTLPWVYVAERHLWVCDAAPNRGTVTLVKYTCLWLWQGCIERPEHFKQDSPLFAKLEQALSWAEQELLALQNAATGETKNVLGFITQPGLTLADFTPDKQPHLVPYWIEPRDLEPERITYQVLIDVQYMPYDYEFLEMSFGKQLRYHERFITPTKLLQELRLDAARVVAKQLLGPNAGWYHLVSTTHYYSESLVIDQAQQLWDNSAIPSQYQAGKVVKAEYGYQEVETDYTVMLGGCTDPEHPGYVLPDRKTYMAELALRYTLVHALDVQGFRAYLGLTPKAIEDDALLVELHQQRAKAPYVPLAARTASQRWLTTHKTRRDDTIP